MATKNCRGFTICLVAAAFLMAPHATYAANGLPVTPGDILEPTRNEAGQIVPIPPTLPPAAIESVGKADHAPGKLTAFRPAPVPVDQKGVTAVNLSNEIRHSGPITFGVFFGKGEVAASVGIKDRMSQLDAKRRWPDGSLKHGILTTILPDMAARSSLFLEFENTDNELLPNVDPINRPNVSVSVSILGGPKIVSTLVNAVPKPAVYTWLDGYLVREILLRDSHPDITIDYHVRQYLEGTRVSVIFDLTDWKAPGNLPYDAKITLNGNEIYSLDQVGAFPDKEYSGQARNTRWIHRFWVGRNIEKDLHIRYDPAEILSTGLLPRLDPTIEVAQSALDKYATSWPKQQQNPLQTGYIVHAFGTTGGRSEIGPLPSWTSVYLVTQNPLMREIVLRHGDLSGSIPIHYSDNTGMAVDIEQHPQFSLNANSRPSEKLPTAPIDETNPWWRPMETTIQPDTAHQGSFAYVPYLITGDYYYLEEMIFWTSYNTIHQHWAYRGQELGLLYRMQRRGTAWAFRNLTHAASLSPEDYHWKEILERQIENNAVDFMDRVAADPAPFGMSGAGTGYDRAGVYLTLPTWQLDYFVWSLLHALDQGYESLRPAAEYFSEWTIDILLHPDEISPYCATNYFLVVGTYDRDAKIKNYAQTWAEVSRLSFEENSLVPPTAFTSTYAFGYGASRHGTLQMAKAMGMSNAAKALAVMDAEVGDAIRQQALADPRWYFINK